MVPCRIVFTLSILLIFVAIYIHGVPVQVCVEESKHKTVDSSMSPLSDVPTEDQRQCIVLCLKDRKSPCRSCVFAKSSCRLFSKTVKEAGSSLLSDTDSMYYEILEDCPPNKTPISTAVEAKRRDLSLTENNTAHQLAVKDMSGVEGPPLSKQQVGGGGGQYPSPGGGQYPSPGGGQYPSPGGGYPSASAAPYQGPAPTYAPAPVPAPAPAPASYGPWSAWTQCPTVPCQTYGAGGSGGAASAGGGAAQTRSRQCQGYGGCQGEAKQTQPCGCQQGEWTEWGPWASCSASCGGGSMSRSRSCTVPNTCQGQATDQQQCGQGPCSQWSPWAGYGSCSATCGSGTQSRQRTCAGYGGVGSGSGCSGSASESMPCPSLPPCCSEWTAWSQCSCSCGSGTQTRTRNCGGGYSGSGSGGGGGGSNTESQACSGGPCANWGNWGPWSSCSVTCSSGQHSRTRQCGIQTCNSEVVAAGTGCPGESQESEACNAGPCAQWGEWAAWGSCSQTCGSGQQSRTRQCTGGSGCIGDSQQSQNCESGPCPEWCPWQNWAQCPVTCGDGQQTRIRTCGTGANCASNASPYGGASAGSFTPTLTSTSCSGESSQVQPCSPSPGPCATWSEWATWNQCSSSCGTGQISRARQCSAGSGCPGEPQQSQPCQGPPCAAWCPWREWTPCSTTCSVGQRTRSRICSADTSCSISSPSSNSCAGESVDAEQCNTGPCPTWSDWEPWAVCSATCGEGQRTRVRQCASGTNCPGESRAVESCSPCAVCPQWDVWTAWGACQTSERQQSGYGAGAAVEGQSCGRGQQTRSRSCVGSCGGAGGCVGESIQNQPCVQQCAEWSPWTNWSICSSTCANGQQTRSRQCSGTGCPGPATDSQGCQMPACVQVQPQGSYYQPQYAGFYQQRGSG